MLRGRIEAPLRALDGTEGELDRDTVHCVPGIHTVLCDAAKPTRSRLGGVLQTQVPSWLAQIQEGGFVERGLSQVSCACFGSQHLNSRSTGSCIASGIAAYLPAPLTKPGPSPSLPMLAAFN